MDVQAQLAKAVQARFRQINGIEEPTPPPSAMRQKVKEPVTIPRADPGAKNAAAAALAAKFGKAPRGGPPTSRKISPAPSGGGPLSSDDEAVAAQYRKMMKVGMPEGAVRHKMMADGVPNRIVEAVMKGDAPPPKQSGGGSSTRGGLTPEEEQIASQYRKMAKVGMPEGAIRHKMTMAGVAPNVQDAVFAAESSSPSNGSGGGSSRGGGGGGAASSLSPQEEQIASQYRKMMKVGMPEGAVRHKMTADGVSTKIQDSVLAGELPGTPSAFSAPAASGGGGCPVSSLSPKEEAIATQYRKMMKIKMPQGAIMQKMALAGVPQNIQDSVLKGEVPASESAPTSASSSMPVNPLAAMIASSGGIGSLRAATSNEKQDRPSGMPGNPLAAAIAASGGMSSLKKSAPKAKPTKSSSDAGGLLGELAASGFTGSLKKTAAKDQVPPKPSSSGGLLGELTASGFKGSLRKTSDHRPEPPKPSSSGGLLEELSASGFKESLKKRPTNQAPPMKSASTGNTDFNKLLEERQKRAKAAAGSIPPRNKLPPSMNVPAVNAGQPKARENQPPAQQPEKASPKKSASTGSSGFGRLFAGRKEKGAPAAEDATPPKKDSAQRPAPPPLPVGTKDSEPPKAIEKVHVAQELPPAKTTETTPSPSEAPKQQPQERATKESQGPAQAPKSPKKMAMSAGSHIAAMLSRREQDKARSPPVSPLQQESAKVEKPLESDPPLASNKAVPAPVRRPLIQTEAQVPPALAALSKPSRPTQTEAPVPPALAAMSKPKAPPLQPYSPKESHPVRKPAPTRVASHSADYRSPPAPIETKNPVVLKVVPTPQVVGTIKESSSLNATAAMPTTPNLPVARPNVPVRATANGAAAAPKAPPARVVPETKPEPKAQVKKEEKVRELANGKQVLDVATTTVNPDGTHARERKRKTKNSDKKSKPQDDGVEHHCACVVM